MSKTYPQAVRYFFDRLGMTQADFCRHSGFSTAYVSMLLKGKIDNPKWDKACEIADALGVTLQDFREYMENED